MSDRAACGLSLASRGTHQRRCAAVSNPASSAATTSHCPVIFTLAVPLPAHLLGSRHGRRAVQTLSRRQPAPSQNSPTSQNCPDIPHDRGGPDHCSITAPGVRDAMARGLHGGLEWPGESHASSGVPSETAADLKDAKLALATPRAHQTATIEMLRI